MPHTITVLPLYWMTWHDRPTSFPPPRHRNMSSSDGSTGSSSTAPMAASFRFAAMSKAISHDAMSLTRRSQGIDITVDRVVREEAGRWMRRVYHHHRSCRCSYRDLAQLPLLSRTITRAAYPTSVLQVDRLVRLLCKEGTTTARSSRGEHFSGRTLGVPSWASLPYIHATNAASTTETTAKLPPGQYMRL